METDEPAKLPRPHLLLLGKKNQMTFTLGQTLRPKKEHAEVQSSSRRLQTPLEDGGNRNLAPQGDTVWGLIYPAKAISPAGEKQSGARQAATPDRQDVDDAFLPINTWSRKLGALAQVGGVGGEEDSWKDTDKNFKWC